MRITRENPRYELPEEVLAIRDEEAATA